jgi:adenosine deaminase
MEHLRSNVIPLDVCPTSNIRFCRDSLVADERVTRTLDPGQAERLRPLLDNSRRLRELVSEFEALALRQVENDPAQPNP